MRSALRIVLASPWAFPFHGYGGLQNYVYQIALRLRDAGHEPVIATSGLGPDDRREHVYEGLEYVFLGPPVGEDYQGNILEGFNRHTYPVRKPLLGSFQTGVANYLGYSIHLARWLDHQQFEVLHAFKMSGVAYLLRRNRRPVATQHFAYEEFFLRTLKARLGMLPIRWGIALSDRLAEVVFSQGACNTRDIADVSWVDPRKIRVLPNGVDCERLTHPSRAEARAVLGWISDEVVLLAVGRLAPDKRVEDTVEVLRTARDRGVNARLSIVGSGPMRDIILTRAAGLGVGAFVDVDERLSDEDVGLRYRGADVYLNTAETRYALLTVMDALAAGVPVVTYRPQEDFVRDGATGYVVGRMDPAGMSERVLDVIENNRDRGMSERATVSVQQYDWAAVAELAVAAYREMMAMRDRRSRSV